MAKIVKLKESDIERLVSKIIKEEDSTSSIGRSYPSDMEELMNDFESDLSDFEYHYYQASEKLDQLVNDHYEVLDYLDIHHEMDDLQMNTPSPDFERILWRVKNKL